MNIKREIDTEFEYEVAQDIDAEQMSLYLESNQTSKIDIRQWSKEFTESFIEEYRCHDCLWRIKSPYYTDRHKRGAAYYHMIGKLREVDPTATKDTVVKKIDSLRSNFRKELKKVREYKKSATGGDDPYKPRLWYYDKLLFLIDQETSNTKDGVTAVAEVESHDDVVNTFSEPKEVNNDYSEIDCVSELNMPQLTGTDIPVSMECTSTEGYFARTRKKSKKKMDLCDEVLENVNNELKRACADEFDVIGQNVAHKLRRLSEDVKIITEKLINDILFEAQMGKIEKGTKMSLQKSFPHGPPVASTSLQVPEESGLSTSNELHQYYSQY